MTSFLQETLQQIQDEHQDWSGLILILPSKRACGFARHYLKSITDKPGFAPRILSIEQLICNVSGLQLLSGDSLLIEAYNAYLSLPASSEKDNFATFCEWSGTVIADFNEMDRYLVPSTSFFSYLKEIKTLERWGAEAGPDDLTKKYLDFWGSLEAYYHSLQNHLLNLNCGYQGMIYRQAAEDVEHYLDAIGSKKHLFIGFNALNAAEQNLVQAMLENGSGAVYWDLDSHFYNNPPHGAARFMRRYFKDWKYYQHHNKPSFSQHYTAPKTITISNAPDQQLQVKYVADRLAAMDAKALSQTAVVLADERLLQPLLLSLPANLEKVNITMGVALDDLPASKWIRQLFLFQAQTADSWYYKDLFRLIDTAVFRRVFPATEDLVLGMNKDNKATISLADFEQYVSSEDAATFKTILHNPDKSAQAALSAVTFFIDRALADRAIVGLDRHIYLQLSSLIKDLSTRMASAAFLSDLPALIALWEEMIKLEQLDFEGDAYDGLQIMGVLETRVLDFEHLIMLSVNEGVLPAGRSNASYITADMKTQFSLPTYQDKDAIYTYHFFRLLQRARTVDLCYNGSATGLTTGEPSRYITQILYEDLPEHQISQQSLSTPVLSTPAPEQARIDKSAPVMARLREISEKGWSPSALTAYLYDPLQFYFDRVIGIREAEELEEEVAASTMGNAVHKVLENLYAPFVGNVLSIDGLDALAPKIDPEMRTQFDAYFRGGSYERGKNLLIFEVAKRFVMQQIARDRNHLADGRVIQLVALEQELEMALELPKSDIPFKLKGTIDRIDRMDGQLRIIDYKTGKADTSDLRIHDWELLMASDKHLKAIQVLVYGLLVRASGIPGPYTAGVISFKNGKQGLINFGKREKPGSKKVDEIIDDSVLDEFLQQLHGLLTEILNPEIPFEEKTPEEN